MALSRNWLIVLSLTFASTAWAKKDIICSDSGVTPTIPALEKAKLFFHNFGSEKKLDERQWQLRNGDDKGESCLFEAASSIDKGDLRLAREYLNHIKSISKFYRENLDAVLTAEKRVGKTFAREILYTKLATTKAATQLSSALLRNDDYARAQALWRKADLKDPELLLIAKDQDAPGLVIQRLDFLKKHKVAVVEADGFPVLHALAKDDDLVINESFVNIWVALVNKGLDPNRLYNDYSAVDLLIKRWLKLPTEYSSLETILRFEGAQKRLKNTQVPHRDSTYTLLYKRGDLKLIKAFESGVNIKALLLDESYVVFDAIRGKAEIKTHMVNLLGGLRRTDQFQILEPRISDLVRSAIIDDDLDLLQYFKNLGFDVTAMDSWGVYPICTAATEHKLKALRFLLNSGASAKVSCEKSSKETPTLWKAYWFGTQFGRENALDLAMDLWTARVEIDSTANKYIVNYLENHPEHNLKEREILLAFSSGLTQDQITQRVQRLQTFQLANGQLIQNFSLNDIEISVNRQSLRPSLAELTDAIQDGLFGNQEESKLTDMLLIRHLEVARSEGIDLNTLRAQLSQAASGINSAPSAKVVLDRLLNSNKTKGKYNLDAINLVDVIKNNRMQCYSGTYTYLLLLRLMKDSNWLNEDQRPVVIFRSGHVLPGFMVRTSGSWKLFGIETTAEGQARIDFGPAKGLPKDFVVVHALDFELSEIYRSVMLNAGQVRSQMILRAQTDFDLPAPKDFYHSSVTAGPALNQTLFSFGESKIPTGDLDRLKADVIPAQQELSRLVKEPPQRPSNAQQVTSQTNGNMAQLRHSLKMLKLLKQLFPSASQNVGKWFEQLQWTEPELESITGIFSDNPIHVESSVSEAKPQESYLVQLLDPYGLALMFLRHQSNTLPNPDNLDQVLLVQRSDRNALWTEAQFYYGFAKDLVGTCLASPEMWEVLLPLEPQRSIGIFIPRALSLKESSAKSKGYVARLITTKDEKGKMLCFQRDF